jgi:acetyltransferase-like isoleucine patch superfamily enzyme
MLKVLRLLTKFYYGIKFKEKLDLHKTILRRTNIHVSKNSNKVIFNHVSIYDSDFLIKGDKNSMSIEKSNHLIYGLSVKIYGENNHLVIEEGAIIYGLRIVIRGNGCHVSIGSNFCENINSMIVCMGNGNYIEIGDDCMLSENIDIWNTDSHQITDISGSIVINTNKNIKIGNHVWIGKNCSILKGVTIGDNSVVGMSSVVTKDMDSNCIYVGNPARKIHDKISWNRNFNLT